MWVLQFQRSVDRSVDRARRVPAVFIAMALLLGAVGVAQAAPLDLELVAGSEVRLTESDNFLITPTSCTVYAPTPGLEPDYVTPLSDDPATGRSVAAERSDGKITFDEISMVADDFELLFGIMVRDIRMTLPDGVASVQGAEIDTGSGSVLRFDAEACDCDDFTARLLLNIQSPGGDPIPIDELAGGPVVFSDAADFDLRDDGQLELAATVEFGACVSLLGQTLPYWFEGDIRLVPEPSVALARGAVLLVLVGLAHRRRRSIQASGAGA